MNFEDWVQVVPDEFRNDPLWKMEVYRLAMFLGDVCWRDVTNLMDDKRTVKLADQLYRALGSISANIEEGYSQGTGKNRARYYRYALGSARESRGWYYKGRYILGEAVVAHRIKFLTGIIRLLLVTIQKQGDTQLREPSPRYEVVAEKDIDMESLLLTIPY